MLATLGVPFDPEAASYAVDTAVESGQPLIVANVTQLEPLPMSLRLGYDALEEFTPEVTESVKRPVELASRSVSGSNDRVRSPDRSEADQLVTERGGLWCSDPMVADVGRSYRRAVDALREGAVCLVWVSPDPHSRGDEEVGSARANRRFHDVYGNPPYR
jgi:hypothetical protein